MKITNKDFVGDEYYRLLDIACKEADIFEFTIKEENVTLNFRNILNKNRLDDAYAEFLQPLQEFFIDRKRTHENRVQGYEKNRKIHVFRYKSINRSKEVIKTFTDHAYGWCAGETPEHLTFYKDGHAILAIVAEEEEICIFDEGEETIFPLLKNHDNYWKRYSHQRI